MEYNFFVEYKSSIQTLDFATYEYWSDAEKFRDGHYKTLYDAVVETAGMEADK